MVWVEDKDAAWIEAEVVDVRDKTLVVVTAARKKVCVFFNGSFIVTWFSFVGFVLCFPDFCLLTGFDVVS